MVYEYESNTHTYIYIYSHEIGFATVSFKGCSTLSIEGLRASLSKALWNWDQHCHWPHQRGACGDAWWKMCNMPLKAWSCLYVYVCTIYTYMLNSYLYIYIYMYMCVQWMKFPHTEISTYLIHMYLGNLKVILVHIVNCIVKYTHKFKFTFYMYMHAITNGMFFNMLSRIVVASRCDFPSSIQTFGTCKLGEVHQPTAL